MQTYEQVIKYFHQNNKLPKGFNQWDLTDNEGVTVKQLYDYYQK